jgi:L-amino acid N-acyltransferase YncA
MQIRAARIEDASAVARVHVDTWRTTYEGIIPQEHLANLSYERAAKGFAKRFEYGESLLVIEEDGVGVIGFAGGGPVLDDTKEYDGQIYAIYILKEWQQKGFGRKLIAEMANLLLQRGMKSLLIWVLSDNKSRAFYESVGGVLVGEKDIVIGGKTLKEVAYGWPDLSVFLKGPDSMDAKKA